MDFTPAETKPTGHLASSWRSAEISIAFESSSLVQMLLTERKQLTILTTAMHPAQTRPLLRKANYPRKEEYLTLL